MKVKSKKLIQNPSASQKAFIWAITKSKIEIFKNFLIKPTSKFLLKDDLYRWETQLLSYNHGFINNQNKFKKIDFYTNVKNIDIYDAKNLGYVFGYIQAIIFVLNNDINAIENQYFIECNKFENLE